MTKQSIKFLKFAQKKFKLLYKKEIKDHKITFTAGSLINETEYMT